MSKYHIVSIDNDHGHISDVTLYSSHDTKKEAAKALKDITKIALQSHLDKTDREQENYKMYVKWASKANVECPNKFGGFNWIKQPGDANHIEHVYGVPYHRVRGGDGQTLVKDDHIQIRSSEPLVLLEELVIPPEHWLEYHLVEPK